MLKSTFMEMIRGIDCINNDINISEAIQMKDFIDLLIALIVIVIFWVYFMNYNIYCIHRNHNKVRELQIKEKRQINFFDVEKVKSSIKDRLFITAFLHILTAMICYSLIEKRVGDNLFFSTGLALSVVILLTGMIVKRRVSTETWSLEYQYFFPKDTEMSNQQKFNIIMSEQEQKNIFVVAAIACAIISWPLCSLKLSSMFLAILVGGVVWFETDIKKIVLEMFETVISFIKSWQRLLVFLIPAAITILTSRIAKDYTMDNYILSLFYGFIIINLIWGAIIYHEIKRERYLDNEWKKILKQQNSVCSEST